MPVLVDEHLARSDKSECDEFFLEIVDNLLLLSLIDVDDFQPKGELEVEHRRHIVVAQFLSEVKDGVNEGDDLVLRQLIDSLPEHPVHVPNQAFALALHTRQVEQIEHIMEFGDEMGKSLFRAGKAGGNLVKER